MRWRLPNRVPFGLRVFFRGTFLLLAHNAANWEATRRSYELFARYVMPRFQDRDRRADSLGWVAENADDLVDALSRGIEGSLVKYKDKLR